MKIKRCKPLDPKYQIFPLSRPESIDGKRLDQDLGKFSNEGVRGSLFKELRKLNDEKRNLNLGMVKDNSKDKVSFKLKSNNLTHEVGELSKEKRNMKL